MEIIEKTKKQVVLMANQTDVGSGTFIFDVNILAFLKPIPKNIVFQYRNRRWSMTWTKFLKQTTIDSVAIIKMSDCQQR